MKLHIVFVHRPINTDQSDDMKKTLTKLGQLGILHEYFPKTRQKDAHLEDIYFDNVADDIERTFVDLKKFLLIGYNHGCPATLYYANKYPAKVMRTICYPFRYYCEESYKRRIWKMKTNGGWKSFVGEKYSVDDYFISPTEERYQEITNDPEVKSDVAKYLLLDMKLQEQHAKIPKVFKVPTVLYTRLDLDPELVLKYNYDRTDVRKMKMLFSENDALQNSMIWNFDRVKHDTLMIKANEEAKSGPLRIKYLITNREDYQQIVDEVILFKSTLVRKEN